MKAGFTTLAKLLAVCLFLGLLSGYVWYRYDQNKKQETARLEALNKQREKAIQAAKEKGVEAELAEDQINKVFMMSSSKSGMVMPSSKSGPAITVQELIEVDPGLLKELEGSNMIFPSSKSGRVILPGSKSGIAIPPPEPEAQQQK